MSTVLCFSWRALQTPIVSLIALCQRLTSKTTMWRCQLPRPQKQFSAEQRTLHDADVHGTQSSEQKVLSSLGAKVVNIWKVLMKVMW